MNADLEIDDSKFCCGIAELNSERYGPGCTPEIFAKYLRQVLFNNKPDHDVEEGYSTFLASTARGLNNTRADFLEKAYKLAGFKKFGRAMKNPNTGNIVTKWYIDVSDKFKP